MLLVHIGIVRTEFIHSRKVIERAGGTTDLRWEMFQCLVIVQRITSLYCIQQQN